MTNEINDFIWNDKASQGFHKHQPAILFADQNPIQGTN